MFQEHLALLDISLAFIAGSFVSFVYVTVNCVRFQK